MVPHLDGVQSAKQPLEQGFQRFHLPSIGEEQKRNECRREHWVPAALLTFPPTLSHPAGKEKAR